MSKMKRRSAITDGRLSCKIVGDCMQFPMIRPWESGQTGPRLHRADASPGWSMSPEESAQLLVFQWVSIKSAAVPANWKAPAYLSMTWWPTVSIICRARLAE